MKIKYINYVKKQTPLVLGIGVFDGVHKGHLKILHKTRKIAAEHNLTSAVLTFAPHPLSVLRPKTAPPLLINLKKRLEIIKDAGIEQVVIARFDKIFSKQNPSRFIKKIILEKLKAQWVVVGTDYRFGKGESGNKELLLRLSEKLNFKVTFIKPLKLKKHKISSSYIRELIKQGRVKEASKHLGRYYSVSGKIVTGRRRGKILKFPTANLRVPQSSILKEGVYAGEAVIHKIRKQAVINIGRKPTFKGQAKTIEVHIFNFRKNIYGKKIEIFFIKRLRSERKFENADKLIRQIKIDCRTAKKYLDRTR